MKFLRILVITAILNIPCAHAMQGSSAVSAILSSTANAVIVTVGVLTVFEGCCNAQFGKSPFLPLPTISNNRTVDHAGKAVVGLVETGIGLTAIAYVLQ